MIGVLIFLFLLFIIIVSVWAYKLWTMFENIEEIKKLSVILKIIILQNNKGYAIAYPNKN